MSRPFGGISQLARARRGRTSNSQMATLGAPRVVDPQVAFAWRQLTPATVPFGRRRFQLATDPLRSTVVMAGGDTGGSATDPNAYTWDGTDWTDLGPVFPINNVFGSSVQGKTSCWDEANGRVVTFGGLPTYVGFCDAGGIMCHSDQTWTFDGTTWTLLSPAANPGPRSHALMAYCGAIGKVVLFGGSNVSDPTGCGCPPHAQGVFTDTWTWDGTNWVQIFPANNPAAPGLTALVALGDDLIGWGGATRRETWRFNGTNWTQITAVSPPSARESVIMAYWPTIDRIVLHGGRPYPGGTMLNDTWQFDGSDWERLLPSCGLIGQREDSGFAFDPNTGSMLLFGGDNPTFNYPIEQQTWVLEQIVYPEVTTGAATAAACSGATLHGTVTPNGANVNVYFFWGPTTSYTHSQLVGTYSGSSPISVSLVISGLSPGSTYHFVIEAVPATGCPAVVGEDHSFVEGACAPHPTVNASFHLSADS